jgi:hypothetical protein
MAVESSLDQTLNVIAFPLDRQAPSPTDTHPLVKSVTEVMVSLGNLARQIEQWPMDPDDKWRMLNTIRALALQACELQLVAVTEVADPAKFRSDLDRVMTALRPPEI